MNRDNFIEILTDSTPEELNEFLLKKGSIKIMNAVTFLDDIELNKNTLKGDKDKR